MIHKDTFLGSGTDGPQVHVFGIRYRRSTRRRVRVHAVQAHEVGNQGGVSASDSQLFLKSLSERVEAFAQEKRSAFTKT